MKVFSLSTPNIRPYAKHTYINHARYCEKWGYEYHHMETSEIPPAWAKLIYMMGEGQMFWIDADAQFMDFDKPLDGFFYDTWVFSENNGLNAGVFALNGTKETIKILEQVYQLHRFRSHPHWEQAALIDYFNRNGYEGVSIDKTLAVDGMHYKKGDFIVHLCGTTFEERVNLFSNYFKYGN